MNKKVLVISPIPSHPQNSGNRSRIYNLLKNFRNLGCKIHFVYYCTEKDVKYVVAKPDSKAMKKEWDEFTYYQDSRDFTNILYEKYRYFVSITKSIIR